VWFGTPRKGCRWQFSGILGGTQASGSHPFREPVLDVLDVKDNYLTVPQGPGIGVEIDEDVLRRNAR
jgi:L-alanine-DL-glutamate epimerase-like enolase superfamily enzyme